jgi:hypothetical protein
MTACPAFRELVRLAARFSDEPGAAEPEAADVVALRVAVGHAHFVKDRWPAEARLLFDECEKIARAPRQVRRLTLKLAVDARWQLPPSRRDHLRVVE